MWLYSRSRVISATIYDSLKSFKNFFQSLEKYFLPQQIISCCYLCFLTMEIPYVTLEDEPTFRDIQYSIIIKKASLTSCQAISGKANIYMWHYIEAWNILKRGNLSQIQTATHIDLSNIVAREGEKRQMPCLTFCSRCKIFSQCSDATNRDTPIKPNLNSISAPWFSSNVNIPLKEMKLYDGNLIS